MKGTGSTKSTKGTMKGESGYRRLLVYQRSLELVVLVYKLTEKLPKSEEFGLKSQMRRAAVSVLSNIAEGYLKSSRKEKVYFLETAETSLLEVDARADVCRKLKYWFGEDYGKFADKKSEVGYLLYKYKSKVR